MSHFRRVLVLVATIFTSTAAAQDIDDQARRRELQKLQGTWIVQTATLDGKERKDEVGSILYIGGEFVQMRRMSDFAFMHLEIEFHDLKSSPKDAWWYPSADPQSGRLFKCALDVAGRAAFHVDGDNLKLCIPTAPGWPNSLSDKKQVLWTLRRETAEYRREKLDQRLQGKKLVHYEKVFKEDDKIDRDVQFAETWYIGCKDTHDYFLEPYVPVYTPFSTGPFPKFNKVLHGLRTVRNAKGDLVLIENWYAGSRHGQHVSFRDGRRWVETNYQFGQRHGPDRIYFADGPIQVERIYVEGRRVSERFFHSNGQLSTHWVGNVLREERDEKGRAILTRKIELEKLRGSWEIFAAKKDGKPRDAEIGGTLTFVDDEVRLTLPGKKGAVAVNVHVRTLELTRLEFTTLPLELRFGSPLEQRRYAQYEIAGDMLRMSFAKDESEWPKDLSDKGQVLWVLKKK